MGMNVSLDTYPNRYKLMTSVKKTEVSFFMPRKENIYAV